MEPALRRAVLLVSLSMNKTEQAAIIEVLHHEHASDVIKANALLDCFEEIFKARASFVVVGQLYATAERRDIPPEDPEALKISLAWYSTEGDAKKAADGLWAGQATGDEFRRWVLPVWHGTPADFHKSQKAKYVEREVKRRAKRSEQIQKDIKAMQARNEEIARKSREGGYDHV